MTEKTKALDDTVAGRISRALADRIVSGDLEPGSRLRQDHIARLVMPCSTVRLSAGRSDLNREAQILCMIAGANSIFYGEALLTTPNADMGNDAALFEAIGQPAEFRPASAH
jgi:biotin synthase